MTDVFISYARATAKNEALALEEALLEKGLSVFLDEKEIPAGGTIPSYLAEALLNTKLVVVFADETYFTKTWCIYEFKVCIAPCQQSVDSKTGSTSGDHIIIALPEKGDVSNLLDHLPVALKSRAWLSFNETAGLVNQVIQQLPKVQETLGKKLEGLNDEAVNSLRTGGMSKAAVKLNQKGNYLKYLPGSLKEKFVGRADKLWEIFTALETKAGQDMSRSVLIEGGAGMGKTQLAAEYVWRYGPAHYPGGMVWINADCPESELQKQFGEVLRKFNIDIPSSVASPNWAEPEPGKFAGLLEDYFSNLPVNQPVLWIVDNVPEPQAGVSLKPITYWCPANESVSLICTSRQSNIKNIDTLIILSELTVPAAIALVTQSPVNKSRATGYEWEKIVKGVGCWPMGLRIIHASLADNLLTPAALIAKMEQKNPSPLLDETVKALQGFVEEGYVRGVSELFEFSYHHLKNFPEALLGAHAIAWLARTPLPEDLMLPLLPGNSLAILGKRHWIEASDHTGETYSKTWVMHRIVAGFFKSHSSQQEAIFKLLIDWFSMLLVTGTQSEKLSGLDTHFRVFSQSLLDYLFQHQTSPLWEEARILMVQVASYQLSDSRARSFRYTAASLAPHLGIEDLVLGKYEEAFKTSEETLAANLPYSLSLLSSIRASNLLLKMLTDIRVSVRWQAILAVTENANIDLLAMPWLDAVLKETDYFFLQNCAVLFTDIFKTASDKTRVSLLDKIKQALQENISDPDFLVSITGRLLMQYDNNFEAGDHTYSDLKKILFHIVETGDRKSAEKAAGQLAYARDSGTTFQQLLDILTFEKQLDKTISLFFATIAYIERLAAPAPLKKATATFNDEGGLYVNLQMGNTVKDLVPYYQPLVYRVAGLAAVKARDQMMEVLGRRQEGLKAIQEEINLLIDEAKWPMVVNLAEGILNTLPVFKVNGHWWRGQAFVKLNRDAEAIEDFTEVINGSPAFSEARKQRLKLNYAANNSPGIKTDLEYLIQESPENFYYLHDLGYICFNLKEYDQALAWLSQCLHLNDQFASAWYLRSYTHFYLDNLSAARTDIDKALSIEPKSTPFQEFKKYLLTLNV